MKKIEVFRPEADVTHEFEVSKGAHFRVARVGDGRLLKIPLAHYDKTSEEMSKEINALKEHFSEIVPATIIVNEPISINGKAIQTKEILFHAQKPSFYSWASKDLSFQAKERIQRFQMDVRFQLRCAVEKKEVVMPDFHVDNLVMDQQENLWYIDSETWIISPENNSLSKRVQKSLSAMDVLISLILGLTESDAFAAYPTLAEEVRGQLESREVSTEQDLPDVSFIGSDWDDERIRQIKIVLYTVVND